MMFRDAMRTLRLPEGLVPQGRTPQGGRTLSRSIECPQTEDRVRRQRTCSRQLSRVERGARRPSARRAGRRSARYTGVPAGPIRCTRDRLRVRRPSPRRARLRLRHQPPGPARRVPPTPRYGAEVVAVGADRAGIEGLDAGRARRRAHLRAPGRRLRRPATPGTGRWPSTSPRTSPIWWSPPGFMKLVGPRVPGRVRRPFRQHAPRRCCPAFPGMHGARDALAYGVKVTGCTVLFVDDGVDTGPIIAQVAVPVARRRRRGHAPRAHQGRRATPCSSSTSGRMARDGWTDRRNERSRSREPTEATNAAPIRRALISVYDKTGLEELARGLHAAGVELVSTGSTAATIAAAGVPGHPGRGADRLPRVPRRPGQDAAPEGARRASSPTCACDEHARAARRARHRAVRAGGLQPLPVHRDRRLRRDARRVRRADRHRRPVHGARRRQEPPVASRSSVDPARYADVLAAVGDGGFTLAERQRLAAEAFAHTADVRRRRRVLVRAGTLAPADDGWPEFAGRGAASAPRPALRREPAPARRALRRPGAPAGPRPGRAAARQGDVVQQLRRRRRRAGAPRTTSPSRASRSSSTPTRAASRSAPTSPRRTARRTPATRSPRSAA